MIAMMVSGMTWNSGLEVNTRDHQYLKRDSDDALEL